MALPWARIDSNIASHDKILALVHDPSAKKWQALSSYLLAIPWSTGQGTDGLVPSYALGSVQGTTTTARLLVKYGLWHEADSGWKIHNFEQRQELEIVREAKRAAQSLGAKKANCRRHHGHDCGCWRNGGE